MKTAIFACVHSAGRSQMAAAWFNQLADTTQIRGVAAGTEPGPCVHPVAIDAMAEVGIDLSGARPQLLTDALVETAVALITMGCGEKCPTAPPGVIRDDWALADPKGRPVAEVRAIRDDIRRRVAAFVQENGWNR